MEGNPFLLHEWMNEQYFSLHNLKTSREHEEINYLNYCPIVLVVESSIRSSKKGVLDCPFSWHLSPPSQPAKVKQLVTLVVLAKFWGPQTKQITENR